MNQEQKRLFHPANLENSVDQPYQTRLLLPNQVEVNVFGANHNDPFVQMPQLKSEFKSADMVVIETDEARLSPSKDAEVYFDAIFSEAVRESKPVICTDPGAETFNLFLVDGGVSFSAIGVSIFATLDLILKRHEKLSRRQVLKLLGLIASGYVLWGSEGGEVLKGTMVGGEGTVVHPQIADQVSYEQFRNAGFLLGLNQLIQHKSIPAGSHLASFVGGSHVSSDRGYTVNGVVDLQRAQAVYEQNLYTHLAQILNMTPTARLWRPTGKGDQATLAERLPIT